VSGWPVGLGILVAWCLLSLAVHGALEGWKRAVVRLERSRDPLDLDTPQQLAYDPFTTFLENEVSVTHLRARGFTEEQIRQIRQDLDTQLMELHRSYRRLAAQQGFPPVELYGWGTEDFYSATRP